MIKNQLLLMVLIVSVVACSHKSKPSDDEQKFVTHINQSGLKQFQFSLQSSFSKRKNSKGTRGSGGRGGKGQRSRGGGQSENHKSKAGGSGSRNKESYEKMRNKLYRKLEQLLVKTEYCRAGFVETDLFHEDGNLSIKGRCKDKASAEDKIRFKNQ